MRLIEREIQPRLTDAAVDSEEEELQANWNYPAQLVNAKTQKHLTVYF